MLFVFKRMCDFFPHFLFKSSCLDQGKDLEGLWQQLRFPAESVLLCPVATQLYVWRKTPQRRGYSRNVISAPAVCFSQGASISLFDPAIIAPGHSKILNKELLGKSSNSNSENLQRYKMKIAPNLGCYVQMHSTFFLLVQTL